MQRKQVIRELRDLGYIGPFPGGLDVLLVPMSSAVDEIRFIEPLFTAQQLKTALKTENIQIFNTLEDWAKFKGLKEKHRK